MITQERSDTTEREERFQELLREVLPKIRILHPFHTDEEVLETAAQAAAYRLSDAAFVWVEP